MLNSALADKVFEEGENELVWNAGEVMQAFIFCGWKHQTIWRTGN